MTYIGATGLDIFDEAIQESSNIIVRDLYNRITLERGYNINYTNTLSVYSSNYTDLQVKYSSNYTDKLSVYSSNYTDLQVKYTSNYIYSTSNILVQ